jgi:hypothetical protein
MRVRDQRNATRRLLGQIERKLEGAGRAGDRHTVFAAHGQGLQPRRDAAMQGEPQPASGPSQWLQQKMQCVRRLM